MHRRSGWTLLLCLSAGLGGCQGEPASYETLRLSPDGYARVFEVTREVIGREFEIASADEASGRIETRKRVLPIGDPAAKEAVALPWRRRPTHEVATAWVTGRDGGSVQVSLKVELLTTGGAEELAPTYDEQRPTTASSDVRMQRQSVASGLERYRVVARDREKESSLLFEIDRRLKLPTD